MLSRSCYTLSLLAIGILNINAKDLDFEDLSDLGNSNYDENLTFDDGARGDFPLGDFSLDDFSSSSSSSSSSLDGLSALLGSEDNDFDDGTANTAGGRKLDFNDGTGGSNLDFGDGHDDSLEPITSTIHITTTICPKGKNSKPTGVVPVPGSDYEFPDGTNIGDTRQDSNLGFPDGTDIGNTLSDSDLAFPDGTDTQNTIQDPDLPFPDGTISQDSLPDSDLPFPDGTKSQDSLADSNFEFPDGTDSKNLQDIPLPIGDDILNKGDSQRVTVTVTQTAPAPTGCCAHAQPAPPSNELGNVCKQMMAICAPYMGGEGGFVF